MDGRLERVNKEMKRVGVLPDDHVLLTKVIQKVQEHDWKHETSCFKSSRRTMPNICGHEKPAVAQPEPTFMKNNEKGKF